MHGNQSDTVRPQETAFGKYDTAQKSSPLKTLPITLEPDPARTVIRPFDFAYPTAFQKEGDSRQVVVAKKILSFEPAALKRFSQHILKPMCERHRNVPTMLLRRFDELDENIRVLAETEEQKLLIGAYFSEEYAFESAALFNPSIVPFREQDDSGDVRFALSLRGIGEGHISSITFRTGNWTADGQVEIDPPSSYAVPPRIEREDGDGSVELVCKDSQDVSETVIFPILASQRQGVEDLRLVTFTDDNGERSLVGTYTAFDGLNVRQELLCGVDFRTVRMRPLTGAMSGYKGMALFPRRINGRYVMLGRQDNENIWLLESDDLYAWENGRPIMGPNYAWDFVQIGNCGSPIEIEEGWLVMTHGVGPVRGYCIGACLLDKEDPSRVLARTPYPLLVPGAEYRGGYVPNVVYSCGSLVRGREILVPYAVGDRFSTFATGSIDDVLAVMERC